MTRQPLVVIFIHSNQDESRRLKEFLDANGVAYIEKDAWNSALVRRELMVLGYPKTPVTLVDGTPIIGFEPEQLTRELQLHRDGFYQASQAISRPPHVQTASPRDQGRTVIPSP